MTTFLVHSIETAPEASRGLLENSLKVWGFIPTLHATLAESPVALAAYTSMYNSLTGQGSLTAQEQQVAFQTVNVLHGCEYCTAGHTYLSRMAQVPEDVIEAQRAGKEIVGHDRYEALRRFTAAVVSERGMVGDAALEAFLAAGFTKQHVLEVVTIVACKTISNYTNHLTHTPFESFMADPALKWVAPANRA